MLPTVKQLEEIAKQKELENRNTYLIIAKSIAEELLIRITYDNTKRGIYHNVILNKTLSHMIADKFNYYKIDFTERDLNSVRTCLIGIINTNTNLFAFYTISGIAIHWSPEKLKEKTDDFIEDDFAIGLNLRIDVEELQAESKKYLDEKTAREGELLNKYIQDVVSEKIVKRAEQGYNTATVDSKDIKRYISWANISGEERATESILIKIREVLNETTEYCVETKKYYQYDARSNSDYQWSIEIDWSPYAVELKKQEKDLTKAKNNDKIGLWGKVKKFLKNEK